MSDRIFTPNQAIATGKCEYHVVVVSFRFLFLVFYSNI